MTDSNKWGYFANGTIHLICSSHNDIAWFDTPAATIAWRDERSITPALDRMSQNDKVHFSMENVLYLLEYLERHPERKEEIHQLVLDKRFDWGATYNQPYESLLSSEQLVRQMYFGRKLVKNLLPGTDARVYYSPDIPGRAMQMPQILAKSGVPYMLISRHKPSLQHWYSPDGSRVLSWSMGHYAELKMFGHAFDTTVDKALIRIQKDLQTWDDEYEQRQIPPHFAYLWSADYIPPKDFDGLLADWNEMRERENAPTIQYSTPEQFLDAVNASQPRLEEIRGERPNIWLYIHGPTHHYAISAKREAGVLLPAAEMFSTIEALLAGSFAKYPVHLFNRAWTNAIYDDHGWGGNNGHITDDVFLQKLEYARALSRELLIRATAKIAQYIQPGRGMPITVFNALSWTRSDPVRAVIPAPNMFFRIVDEQGTDVPFQRVSPTIGIDLEVTFISQDVPAIGYRTYYVVDDANFSAAGVPKQVQVGENIYENAFYRVEFAPGGIRSLFDKELGKEILRTEKLLGAEVVMLDSVGNGAGEFSSVQQPSAAGDFERASSYNPHWGVGDSGLVYTTYTFTQQLQYVLLVQRVIFYHHIKRIDVEISLYNWIGMKSREFRMMLPINLPQNAQIAYEVPMGVVEVGKGEVNGAVTSGPVYNGLPDDDSNIYQRGPAYLDVCADIHPREVQNFISAVGEEFAVTMSSSVAVCDYIDPSLSVAPYPIIQPILLASRKSCHSKGNWYLQGGNHHYHFSIFSHGPDWREGRKPAIAANHDLHTVVDAELLTDAHLPPTQSFATLSADNLTITAIKKSEDDDSVTVRVVEMEGTDTTATLNLNFPMQRAVQTNLVEEDRGPVKLDANGLSISVGHHAIETFKLFPAKK
jgi:alpha-mannosidase